MKGIANRQKRIVTPRRNRGKSGLPSRDVQKEPARRVKVPKRTGRTLPPSAWIVIALGMTAWSCASSGPGTAVPLEARVKQLESSAPGVGEVMSGVQLHFGVGQGDNRLVNGVLQHKPVDVHGPPLVDAKEAGNSLLFRVWVVPRVNDHDMIGD